MTDYKIITDSGCDLPKEMLSQLNVQTVPLIVNFRGEDLEDSVDEGIKDMYAGLRNGEVATTSAVNPDRWMEKMESVLAQGQDVLTITFSSGLSTTYQSAVIAGNELKEKYPDRKIIVVDSLCAALGQGLLIWYTCKMKDAGMSIDELAAYIPAAALEETVDERELGCAINRFLGTVSAENRALFLRRYWFGDPLRVIARDLGLRENTASVRLNRLRMQLREYLIKEGYVNE